MKLNSCNEALVAIKRSFKSETVTAVFPDATSITGTVLIGADRSCSVVRQILLGPQKATPKCAYCQPSSSSPLLGRGDSNCCEEAAFSPRNVFAS